MALGGLKTACLLTKISSCGHSNARFCMCIAYVDGQQHSKRQPQAATAHSVIVLLSKKVRHLAVDRPGGDMRAVQVDLRSAALQRV
jgi:hypothetical protein